MTDAAMEHRGREAGQQRRPASAFKTAITKSVSHIREARQRYSVKPARLFAWVLILAAMASMVSGTASAAACASSLSKLDCQALTDDWVDWVPLGATSACTDISTTLAGSDNAQKIFNFFVGKGYTPAQAAGIVGNTTAESGNVPTRLQDGAIAGVKTISYQQIPPNIATDSSIGWGIVQWSPATKVGNYSQSSGENPDDLATQVEFLWKQLEGTAPNNSEKPAGDALKATTNYKDAALTFMNLYERPGDPATSGPPRVEFAKEALAAYQNAGSTGGSSGSNAGCGGIAGSCTTPAPGGGYIAVKAALLSQFKINIQGLADANWATETYNTVCAMAKAPSFFSKLTGAGAITVTLHSGGCGSGHANAATGVDLYGFCDKDYNRFILSHELGHMTAFRNPSIYADFQSQVFPHKPLLPTWDCLVHAFGANGDPLPSGPYSGDQQAECWADMVGEYLIWFNLRDTVSGAPPGPSGKFTEYPTQYAVWYDFARDHLFGGVEYKSF